MVFVEHLRGERRICPTCGEASPGYDTRHRRWRHLDTMQYRTVIEAEVPRVRRDGSPVSGQGSGSDKWDLLA